MIYYSNKLPSMRTTYLKKIKGKTILITGGTGSFGNTVVTELLNLQPKRIIIYSRDEKKQFDMRNKFENPLLKFVIGDVRDERSVERVMEGVDYVFHAAALKQVPTCEFFPMEAVKTNVLGTQNVLSAARNHKVKRVVVLSTDKAVYPINVIGLSKAMMEKIMVSEAKNFIEEGKKETIFCGVRYGNVLYTRGSVLPYFVNIMKQNKKIPVTHFEMTRFLLPLSQAVDLVMHALVYGENGHIYVRKSPACTLETLAKAMCEIFKYQQGYQSVGIRAGEKMHETLITQEEFIRSENVGNYYKVPPESQGLDYNKYFFRGKKANINTIQSYTSENTKRLNVEETIEMLLKLPEIRNELKNWSMVPSSLKKRGRPQKLRS